MSADANVFANRAFLWLVVAVTAAFAWIVRPFFGALLWATILAILFRPLYLRLARSVNQAGTPAALATLFVVVTIVILPTGFIGGMLLEETTSAYQALQSGRFDPASMWRGALSTMPAWLSGLLQRFELTDAAVLQQRLGAGLAKYAQVLATRILDIGQNTFDFVVNVFIASYLLFFFLRDGDRLVARIRGAMPLPGDLKQRLAAQITNTIRAIVKGTIVVAIVQGALGGLILSILGVGAPVFWGVVMAFLSLLPAVGTALVWGPIAIYFIATGAIVKGVVLVAYGALVIGLVDNVLRPLLVGKDMRIPDWVVLITTLGGIAVLGINGLVVGPLIAALFIAIWAVVAQSRRDAE